MRTWIALGIVLILLGSTVSARQAESGGHVPGHERGASGEIPVAVLLYDGALLLDYGVAAEMFLAANFMRSFRIYTVARHRDVRVSILGHVRADHTLASAPPPRVVIVPGGPTWEREGGDPETVAFLERAQAGGATLFSICSGSLLLAKAGVLSGRAATTHGQAIPMLTRLAPDAKVRSDVKFVDDGNVMTAAGAGNAVEATLHLVARLAGPEIAQDLRDRYLEYPGSALPLSTAAAGPDRAGGEVFVDPRDRHGYPLVTIGEQTWMARNLAVALEPSWCYEDQAEDCEPNGRLYPWETAIKACPDGWRLPSDEDWMELERHLGMAEEELDRERFRGTDQGARLRGGGDTGFAAPISGYRRPDGSYARRGARSAYWLSTEADSSAAWHRDIRSDDGRIYRSAVPKEYSLSVRCLRDE